MIYDMNYRCFYQNGSHTDHHRFMELKDIEKWIEAYIFTHPEVEAISVKIWRHTEEKPPE